MGKLTIKDIARIAGVSPTVVSFVINNKSGVNKVTRQKVLDVISKTNFKPSINSRRLAFKKSFNISIVVRNDASPFHNLFYTEIAQGLLESSKKYGYNIVFTDITQDESDFHMPDIIEQGDTDGVIFFQDIDITVINHIESLGIPVVVIDAHYMGNYGISCVNADYEASAYTAVKYLVDNGHKDIAFIGSSFLPNFYNQIFSGYKRALDEKAISVPFSRILINAHDEQSAYYCMEEILKSEPIPTAVFCAADIYAISAIKCAKSKGYHVPEDISFIAIDDIILANYVEPALTTIKIDKILMGKLAIDLLLKRINKEDAESVFVISDTLIVRDSVINRITINNNLVSHSTNF